MRFREWRAEHAGVTELLRIVLRSPDTADIVYEHTPHGARFEIIVASVSPSIGVLPGAEAGR